MQKILNQLGRNEHINLSFLAIVIGVVVGYGAIAFRYLIEAFQSIFMGHGGEHVVQIVSNLEWWHILFMPVVGGVLVGPLVHFFFPGSRGHGVPEVIHSVALQGGKMTLKDGLGKMIACSLSIGSGGSVGREGPVVHLGATLSSWFGTYLKKSKRHMRTMVGCGAAAGIAASFNAPIAGVMFALEVILADYGLATFSPIVLSSVIATVVARMHLGDYPAFTVHNYALVSAWEIPAYVGLGVLCGITGIIFMKFLFKSEDIFKKFPLPRWIHPAFGGFVLGAVALVYPQVLGVGYDTMNMALLENLAGPLMLVLIAVKIFATSVTLASGFSGGVFTPSLFLGAMVGGGFGTYAHALFPAISAGSGAYALVGMGAMAASVLGAPIASILILFELTGDYHIMLPLMVSSIVATLVINQVYRDSVYTQALKRKGIDLHAGRETGLLREITVSAIMRKEYETIGDTLTVRRLKEKILFSNEEVFLVVDKHQRLKGMVSFQDIREIAFEEEGLEDLVLVRDIACPKPETITPIENLYDAFRRMSQSNIDMLPVVAENNPTEILGVITNYDVIKAYDKALIQRETTLLS